MANISILHGFSTAPLSSVLTTEVIEASDANLGGYREVRRTVVGGYTEDFFKI
jgi:hypothetical protein